MNVTMVDSVSGERVSIPTDWLPNSAAMRRTLPDGSTMEVRDLDPHDLRVDGDYQRVLSRQRVHAYARDWNYVKAFMLTVSARGTSDYVIVDGQHRWAAALEAGVGTVPCLILYGLTRQAEAALFAALSTERVGLNTRDRFRARLVAGDPVCANIMQAVEECDFHVNLGPGTSTRPDLIESVAHLELIYRRGLYPRPRFVQHGPTSPEEGKAAVRRVLHTIAACWPQQKDARRHVMLEAVGIFWQHYAAEVSLEALAEKLRLTSATQLLRQAHGYRQSIGGSEVLWLAHSLVETYNKRRTTRRLPPRLPLPGALVQGEAPGED